MLFDHDQLALQTVNSGNRPGDPFHLLTIHGLWDDPSKDHLALSCDDIHIQAGRPAVGLQGSPYLCRKSEVMKPLELVVGWVKRGSLDQFLHLGHAGG